MAFRAFGLLLSMSLVIQYTDAGNNKFSRPCNNRHFCKFDNKLVRDQLFLSCTATTNGAEVSKCDCRYEYVMADVDRWDVAWNKKGQCSIGKTGPCGVDNGVEIVCDEGLECLKGRCRDKNEVGKANKDQSCYEDIDCQPGLICRAVPNAHQYIDLRCFPPGHIFPAPKNSKW